MKDFQKNVLDFWFVETKPQQWFQADVEFDKAIIERFSNIYAMAVRGDLDEWKENADGALALCILLDQMPRNMFRGTAKAFETDKRVLIIAKYAISKSLDQELSVQKRSFLYLPFEHSEDLKVQNQSVELFEKIKDDAPLAYDYAVRHFDVIEKYGRFPHRNKILERMNTPEEDEYLAQPNAGF